MRKRLEKKACLDKTGFTLVELLIVVIILGIMAAVVVPQFLSAADDTRQGAIKANLRRTRTQLEIYRQEHQNCYPTLAGIVDQLTMASMSDGSTASVGTSGFDYGPYLQPFPVNPSTRGDTVSNGPVGSSDWYYDETNGDFRANDSVISRTW